MFNSKVLIVPCYNYKIPGFLTTMTKVMKLNNKGVRLDEVACHFFSDHVTFPRYVTLVIVFVKRTAVSTKLN